MTKNDEHPIVSHSNAFGAETILTTLLDHLPSGVTIFGADLEMIVCNAKLREMLEFPPELFVDGLPSLPKLFYFNAMRGEYGPGDPHELTAQAVARANQRMAEMFGCSMEALVGSEYVAHIHPSQREIGRQKMLDLMGSRVHSVDLERQYWREDGGEFLGNRFHRGRRARPEPAHAFLRPAWVRVLPGNVGQAQQSR